LKPRRIEIGGGQKAIPQDNKPQIKEAKAA
jgi:hypothetical protein